MILNIQYTHKNLSKTSSSTKTQFKWLINHRNFNITIELIKSSNPQQIRVYIDDKIVAISNQGKDRLEEFYFSDLIKNSLFLEIIEKTDEFDLLINKLSYKAYLSEAKKEREEEKKHVDMSFLDEIEFEYVSIDDDYLSKLKRRV